VTASEDLEALLALQRASFSTARRSVLRGWPEEQALDAEGLAELLARRYCVLATGRADGRPQAMPVAFLVAESAFWFGTGTGGRLRNLRALPWCSVVVMVGERDVGESEGEPHRVVAAEGPVRLHEGEALTGARSRLDAAWSRKHRQPPDWAAALIELRPERLFSHGARADLGR